MTYKVTYALDSLDSNPTVRTFDCHYEMEEWITEAVMATVDHIVQHSQYTISDSELDEIMETEYSLIRIENI
tara:strand:+ start:791 stop:1006 length:216 start_codon:yes stop_codon:yes gene_type:complete